MIATMARFPPGSFFLRNAWLRRRIVVMDSDSIEESF